MLLRVSVAGSATESPRGTRSGGSRTSGSSSRGSSGGGITSIAVGESRSTGSTSAGGSSASDGSSASTRRSTTSSGGNADRRRLTTRLCGKGIIGCLVIPRSIRIPINLRRSVVVIGGPASRACTRSSRVLGVVGSLSLLSGVITIKVGDGSYAMSRITSGVGTGSKRGGTRITCTKATSGLGLGGLIGDRIGLTLFAKSVLPERSSRRGTTGSASGVTSGSDGSAGRALAMRRGARRFRRLARGLTVLKVPMLISHSSRRGARLKGRR